MNACGNCGKAAVGQTFFSETAIEVDVW